MSRDDFSKATIEILAKRVGNRCSNPACRKSTSGPHTDPAKALNTGVAAHITAAASGGPRYDATLSSQQRKQPENGLWLCQACGKLVDNDAARYTVELLCQWKQQAERDALSRVGSSAADRLQRVFLVPHRLNPYFQGREDELEQLHRTLNDSRRAALGQAISGLGGIGKTQTAVAYAYRYRDEYQAVLWVQAETTERLISGFVQIAEKLQLPHNRADAEAAVQATKVWLESQEDWLLVLDNADEPELVEPFLPADAKGKGHVLLSSRASVFDMLGIAPLKLDVLPIDEAVTFLFERTERRDAAELPSATELAEEVGCLPLALEQAGAYILGFEVSFTRYLELYRKQPLTMLEKRGPVAVNYQQLAESQRDVFA